MRFFIRSLLGVLLTVAAVSAQELRVVTTQPDLAFLAEAIGGDDVRVYSLTKGTEDLHLQRTRPSMLVRLSRADVLLELGLDAEHAWLPALLQRARNRKIRPGGPGFLNCSALVKVRRKPTARTRASGPDLHPRGNPHFNLDPENVRLMARLIRDHFSKLNPDRAARYRKACARLEEEIDAHMKVWTKKLAPFKGAAFMEHHDAWTYFAHRFGLRIVARLEPAPGLAPTPSHLARVIKIGRREHVGIVAARPANADVAEKVARAIGAKTAILPLSSTTKGRYKGYFHYMDQVVDTFAAGLKKPENR
ncbi:MAG TPA: zinc ABC transporter substrate-binding protein [Planctomycetes bacterium]|nr:zinc ABC transporter substrate-binding protein [Planctomycetota bacterium]